MAQCKSCGIEIIEGKMLCNNCLPSSVRNANKIADEKTERALKAMKGRNNANSDPMICTVLSFIGWFGVIGGIISGWGYLIIGILCLSLSKIISLLNSINNKSDK